MHFFLHDLIAAVPPHRRELVQEVSDLAFVAKQIPVTGARVLELATDTEMVFCKNESLDLIDTLLASRSRFIIARPEIRSCLPADFMQQRVFLLTPQPRLLLALLLAPFDQLPTIARQDMHIHPKAQIAANAILAPGVVIGPAVCIQSGCVVGPNTVIDHATLGKDTQIGPNCSIGGNGFGFEVDEESGDVIRFPHFGSVEIGERVEIFANVTIDRGSLRNTIVEDDVKIDNLVYIAHNCHIRHGTLIMAKSAMMGSVTVGEYAWIAPSTSILNGLTVGRCAMTGMGAVVIDSVGDNDLVVGVPARKIRNRYPAGSSMLPVQ